MALRDLINPLRRTPSSSTSSGGIDVPLDAELELGSTLAFPLREIVPDLANKVTEYRTYYQMANYHSVSRSSLRSVKSSIMGAEFFMEPAGDEDIDKEIAEFVWYNLTEALNNPWLINLARFTKFCEYGASIFETVYENRDWAPKRKGANHKIYTMLKKLAPRPIASVSEVIYDDSGGPVEVVQMARRRDGKVDETPIPIQKLVIFTHDEDNGDLLGKSMLRSAYPHWYYIQHLYKVDAIQKERHGTGVPKAKIPPGLKDKDKQEVLNMLKNIRTNEHAGVLEPFGIEILFMDMPGQLVNVLHSIEHHNAMIMLNVLAEFLVAGIGEGGGGGRSTAASQQDVFMKANWAHANMICGSINTYLIPYLVGFNYDVSRFPKLNVRNLGDTRDIQQLFAALANAFDKEIITPDLETEQWARRVAQMPRKTEARPELSPTQIRELIQIKNNGAQTQGISGPGTTGNQSTVKADRGGNMGKGPNVN